MPRTARYPATHDHGYFPNGSVLRRVQRERVVGLLYGQRALAIGAIDPRNFVGTMNHTRSPERPFRRLALTGKMFEEVFFGTRAEADRVLHAVRRMHAGVVGDLKEDAGEMPAGTPYSALDSELMLWTVAASAESAAYFYELFVRRLTDSELDRFWAEWVRFGELFGMDPSVAPSSWLEFREYFDAKVNGGTAHLTPDAVRVGRAVMLQIPAARSRWPAMRVHNVIVKGTLPRRVRDLYGLRFGPAEQAASRASVSAARAARPLTPRTVRRGRCTAYFDDVIAAERALVRSGRPAPGAIARAA